MANTVLLDHSTSVLLRNYCLAVRAATLAPPPTLAVCCRSPGTRQRRQTEAATSELSGSGRGGCRAGNGGLRHRYIVNPSRYPPSYMYLWMSRTGISVSDYRLSSPECLPPPRVPPTLSSVSVPYRRIPLQIDHLLTPPDDAVSPQIEITTCVPTSIGDSTMTRLSFPSLPPSSDAICAFSSPSLSPSPQPSPDKPSPSQLSFVLLKLREEVSIDLAWLSWSGYNIIINGCCRDAVYTIE